MDAVKGHVKEERFVLGLAVDHPTRFVAQEVRRVAFLFHGFPVAIPVEFATTFMRIVIEHAEVMSVMVFKAAGQREVFRFEFPEMPFADDLGRVARLFQGIRQRTFRERESPGGVRTDDRIDAGARGVASREQRRAGRRADGLHIVVLQHGTRFGESVDVRRQDLLAAVETAVGVTEVINQQEDDVWLGRGIG